MIKFEADFITKNTTYEKAMFHLRAQRPGKYLATFVRALHKFTDGCNFTNKNEEIKDRFIIGLQD